jgi:hypothetical protein
LLAVAVVLDKVEQCQQLVVQAVAVQVLLMLQMELLVLLTQAVAVVLG